MGIGSTIKELLTERGMTIKELSEKTGIPLNTLYSITKRDTQNVRSDNLQAIAAALDVSIDFLIEVSGERVKEISGQKNQLLSLYQKYSLDADQFMKTIENYNNLLADNDLTHDRFLNMYNEYNEILGKIIDIRFSKDGDDNAT